MKLYLLVVGALVVVGSAISLNAGNITLAQAMTQYLVGVPLLGMGCK